MQIKSKNQQRCSQIESNACVSGMTILSILKMERTKQLFFPSPDCLNPQALPRRHFASIGLHPGIRQCRIRLYLTSMGTIRHHVLLAKPIRRAGGTGSGVISSRIASNTTRNCSS